MKRLVCALDGTWNDDDDASPLTNVAKLSRAVLYEDERGVRQLVRYVVGVASSQNRGLAFLKGALGFEISDQIKAAYRFLSNAYEPGDEVYLFGFSRGAYEARSLASFISLFGLASKGSDFLIDDAWAVYRQPERKRDFNTVAEIGSACHYPVRIRCLGLWDTVDNIGNRYRSPAWLSRKFDQHDTRLHDTIDVALHALSIDEARSSFRPTLLTYPKDDRLPSRLHVEQVWFAGSHADVGGGSPETGLSDIALLWMAERIHAKTGLAIDIDTLKRECKPDPLGVQHECSTGWPYALSGVTPYVRPIQQSRVGHGLTSLNEAIHESALLRLGQTVKQIRGNGKVRNIVYAPAALRTVEKDILPAAGRQPIVTSADGRAA